VEIIIQEWIETAKELGRPIPAPRGRLAFRLRVKDRTLWKSKCQKVRRPPR